MYLFFFFKQKTAYEMRISDWSSDVCSSDLDRAGQLLFAPYRQRRTERRPNWEEVLTEELAIHAGFLFLRRQSPLLNRFRDQLREIGRASCRERVCQYV